MIWADFEPFVMPYVLGVPMPMMEHHCKLAAIAFFRRTLRIKRTLQVQADGLTPRVQLPVPLGMDVVRVLTVQVKGKNWPVTHEWAGVELAAQNDEPIETCWMPNRAELLVYPLQLAATPVAVLAALAPSMSATGLDDVDAQDVMPTIADGAIASICAMPNQPFTQGDVAAMKFEAFNRRMAVEAFKAERGFLPVRVGTARRTMY
jgi:hypothetical protein